MGIFGLKKSRQRGSGRALAYLADVQRLGSALRIEDARGREVRASIERMAGKELHLSVQSPLDLDPGVDTHLVFILYGFRFKAPTRALSIGEGAAVVRMPLAVNMAERRKVARGFLNFALAGLFSPLAASGSVSMETTRAFVYETGFASAALEGASYGSIPSAEPIQTGQRLSIDLGPASNSPVSAMQVKQWLRARNITLNDPLCFSQPNTITGQNPFVKRIHGGTLSTRAVTYTFLNFRLPTKWRSTLHASRAKFEIHFNRDNIFFGLRLK